MKKTIGSLIFATILILGAYYYVNYEEDIMDSKEEKSLIIEVLSEGDGLEVDTGDTVKVHYTGTLEDGTVFDSSRDREPFSFTIGEGRVIQGWEEGVKGMKEGELRRLTISHELAYGPQGIPGAIPPMATLIFEIELLEIN